MEIHNLEKSGFRRLKLVDCSTTEGDYNGGLGGDLLDHSYPLQKLFQQFTDLLKTKPRLMAALSDKEKEVMSAGFSAEVGQLLAQPSIVSLIDKFIASYGEDSVASAKNKKSVAASAEYRTRGNEDYALGQLAQAAYYYTMAIVYAPDADGREKGSALSLAYGNRSAVFFQLGKYEACLADIDRAFAAGYPPVKHPKMLLRKVECLISLDRHWEANEVHRFMVSVSMCWMNNEPGSVSMETAARIRQIGSRLERTDRDEHRQSYDHFAYEKSPVATNQMLSIIKYLSRTGRYEPSTKLPPFSAKLEPRTTANGNCLVAKQDIEPGTILMVESPFVSVLNRKFEFHFCHHCARRLEVNIGKDAQDGQVLCIGGSSVPCTHCTRVLYCSTDCRAESWRQYHQFECAILPLLYEMTNFGHLALRTLLLAGLDVASRAITRNVGREGEEQVMPDFSEPKDVEANYETVHRLSLPERESPPAELALFQLASAVMMRALMKQSQFVRTDEEVKLVGTILQRHFIQAYVKSHKILSRIFIAEDSATIEQAGVKAFSIGLGIYPFLASAWKHSCDPNTKYTCVDGSLVLYRATKCIPAGTEVTISLGTSFREQDWNARQEALWKKYGFKCGCARCVLESRDGLQGKYFPIGCKDCGCALTRPTRTATFFNCSSPTCSTVMSQSTVTQLYAQVDSHLAILRRLYINSMLFNPINPDQLAEAEQHLAQLSNMKGMGNYFRLGLINYILACLYASNGSQDTAHKFRQYCERFINITEHNDGVCDVFFMLLMAQIDFYRQGAAVDGGGGGQIRYAECYPQAIKRAIELTQLFSLADPKDESTAPNVLVEESRDLWKVKKNLVDRLKNIK